MAQGTTGPFLQIKQCGSIWMHFRHIGKGHCCWYHSRFKHMHFIWYAQTHTYICGAGNWVFCCSIWNKLSSWLNYFFKTLACGAYSTNPYGVFGTLKRNGKSWACFMIMWKISKRGGACDIILVLYVYCTLMQAPSIRSHEDLRSPKRVDKNSILWFYEFPYPSSAEQYLK